ncbi:MAG: hypothetical protein JW803_03995 [Endomicrobiales bacterium]|nr:hypothetical protein [Endomicrobiales bacterium]
MKKNVPVILSLCLCFNCAQLIGGLPVKKIAIFNSVDQTSAVKSLAAVSTSPVDALNSLVRCENPLTEGFAKNDSPSRDSGKHNSNAFINGFKDKVSLMAPSGGLVFSLFAGDLGYLPLIPGENSQVPWPPGGGVFIYLLMLTYLLVLVKKSSTTGVEVRT